MNATVTDAVDARGARCDPGGAYRLAVCEPSSFSVTGWYPSAHT